MADAILSWCVFAVFCSGLCVTLRRAELRWFQGPTITRADSPAQYWFWTATFAGATCFCLLAALSYSFAR